MPFSGLLIAVAPRYRYYSGATFTVAVAVAPLLLAESSGDSSAATFLALFATATFKKENYSVVRCSFFAERFLANSATFHVVDMLFVKYVPSPSNLYSRLPLKFS